MTDQEKLNKIKDIDSPVLYSVYRGMQGNLALQAGDKEEARGHFLAELAYATRTKHMRLLRALDLVENWLVSQPLEDTQKDAQWFIEEWQKQALCETYPEVEEAMKWLIEHRRYIPDNA